MKKLLLVMMIVTGFQTWAQEVKDFTLVNVLNGQPVSLSTYPSCSGVVIVFTSNACPYDEYYRGRINTIAKTYTDKVPVLLVNSLPDASENIESMVRKAKQANIAVPYLADKDQTLMTSLNAKKSPEVFLLKNNGGNFSVVYRGAIDDNPQVEVDVRRSYLKDAIDIMLANQNVATPEIRPVGCNLKKK